MIDLIPESIDSLEGALIDFDPNTDVVWPGSPKHGERQYRSDEEALAVEYRKVAVLLDSFTPLVAIEFSDDVRTLEREFQRVNRVISSTLFADGHRWVPVLPNLI